MPVVAFPWRGVHGLRPIDTSAPGEAVHFTQQAAKTGSAFANCPQRQAPESIEDV
jgi:hypothetical protein